MATRRSRLSWRARKTSPMPPWPRRFWNVYPGIGSGRGPSLTKSAFLAVLGVPGPLVVSPLGAKGSVFGAVSVLAEGTALAEGGSSLAAAAALGAGSVPGGAVLGPTAA